jgi:hypothetical protein
MVESGELRVLAGVWSQAVSSVFVCLAGLWPFVPVKMIYINLVCKEVYIICALSAIWKKCCK